jgi:hypothetical protein
LCEYPADDLLGVTKEVEVGLNCLGVLCTDEVTG